MFGLTAVKCHDSIDSRSIDMFVSQPDIEHTLNVSCCFISLVFYMQIFQATIVSLPHYDEGPIDYLQKSRSQAYHHLPRPGENKRQTDKYTIERTRAQLG